MKYSSSKLRINQPNFEKVSFLKTFKLFLKNFNNKSILMSIQIQFNNLGNIGTHIVTYIGKYTIKELKSCKKNIARYKNDYIEDLSDLLPESFLINIDKMTIYSLKKTIDNKVCYFSKEYVENLKNELKLMYPSFLRKNTKYVLCF